MNNDLSKYEIGDWIATTAGWKQLNEINHNFTAYPISIGDKTYTPDGRYKVEDIVPSAFVEPPEWLLEYIGPKPCSFEKDDLVMVKGYDDLDEMLRYFAYYEGDKYYTYDNGNTSITSRGRTSSWKYCRKAIEGEDY